ncbi:MAG: PilT/PilU family type 4a pilus ATPase [Victivallaceae bacterium]|nr:PilT/PilU family type 4a pilus ATPase [Victivallaceae bacterium]
MQIKELLDQTTVNSASDLFVTAGKVPYYRKYGKVVPADKEVITVEEVDAFRTEILLPESEKSFQSSGGFDAGITLPHGGRFRINFLMQQSKPALVARPVPIGNHLSFKELKLPESLAELAECQRGLILISGSAGSGKSTTMAAMINLINDKFQKHIVSIEDPIEFIHHDNKSLITQREVGADTVSFAESLKNVVRESPDVIVVGEMRDLATMQTAITAALTGHLVISTVHTADTVQAIERIINHFPEHLRQQTADDLAMSLQGVVAQRLLERSDGSGMVPAVEFLKATPLVRNIISERNFNDLDEAIKRGGAEGMVTFNRAIFRLYSEELITLETGSGAASNSDEFLLLVRGMESGIETFRDSFSGDSSDDLVDMKRLLKSAIANEASDLLLTTGACPTLRINGSVVPLDLPILNSADTKRLLFSVLTPRQRAHFEEQWEIDFAMTTTIRRSSEEEESSGIPYRFRVNGFYQRGNIGVAIRVIPVKIPSLEELKIPRSIVKLTEKQSGLVLVTGPTGHGKSTSLAALISLINKTRRCHIITIEDPIEYVHENNNAVVEQREVNADTKSFTNALKYVLRQDPDVILIGEMRDPETIAAALTAAETGHLVFATLHTNTAPQSIDRIIDSFPAMQQNQIRLQLAETILGILSQRLIENRDGDGRVAAFEVMLGTHAVKSLIREGKTSHLQSVIETSYKDGMITMDKALSELYQHNLISRKTLASMSRMAF